VGQGSRGLSLEPDPPMKHEFNHAANDSPRSGSSKQVTPMVWAGIVVIVVVLTIWFAVKL
jgi:hypothetical protein